MDNKIILVLRAINHRTLKAKEYEDIHAKDIYKNMNISAIQTLFALNVINDIQYETLYRKIYNFEPIRINDI